MQNEKNEKSFTLLELLIVIAVIAILAAIVLVALDNAKQSAQEARGLQFSQNIRTTLATDLVGEWSFDSGSGAEINVADDSGNGNNGIWNDVDPSPWYDKGKVRKAGQFFGNNYVSCGNNINLRLSKGSKITLEAWFKTSNTGAIITKRKSGNTDLYGIFVYSDRISFYFRGSDGSGVNNIAILGNYRNGNWYHVVATYDSSNGKFNAYLNGENKITGTYNVNTDISLDGNLEIGTQYGTSYFTGLIDEPRIYKAALTAYEIKALYAQGKMRHLAEK